ncbi:IS66 family transposase [Thauera sp. SDU_THAU2]|uniref:IS66 family transposase n=1 Tax=Thauera sp. SDU_THAU2 TaxID=3136633 RepID=UPI0040552A19
MAVAGAEPAGPCAGLQVLRPLALVPSKRHLRPQRRWAGTAPRWPAGSIRPISCWTRWWRRWGATPWRPRKIHADDTPVSVLQPGRGKTKTGRLWVYVRDDRPIGSSEPPAAWYQYTRTARVNTHSGTCG